METKFCNGFRMKLFNSLHNFKIYNSFPGKFISLNFKISSCEISRENNYSLLVLPDDESK